MSKKKDDKAVPLLEQLEALDAKLRESGLSLVDILTNLARHAS